SELLITGGRRGGPPRWGAGEGDLGAVDRAQAGSGSSVGKLHRAIDTVVVGQRERLVTEFERSGGELLGQRGAVEEGVRGVAVQLDISHGSCLRRSCASIRSALIAGETNARRRDRGRRRGR